MKYVVILGFLASIFSAILMPIILSRFYPKFIRPELSSLVQNFAMFSRSKFAPPVVMGDESLMKPKAHGTCPNPPMKNLRWGVSYDEAEKICCFNRHYAEYSGYFLTTKWAKEVDKTKPTEYYDSITGNLLFTAPNLKERTYDDFLAESEAHGWPSFRDSEVNWDSIRILPDGECVSKDGTHLGHNIPDKKGNRYCINLVCIAGTPVKK